MEGLFYLKIKSKGFHHREHRGHRERQRQNRKRL